MRKNDFSGLEEEEILHLAKKQCLNLLKQSDKTEMQLRQIGRASCRERV